DDDHSDRREEGERGGVLGPEQVEAADADDGDDGPQAGRIQAPERRAVTRYMMIRQDDLIAGILHNLGDVLLVLPKTKVVEGFDAGEAGGDGVVGKEEE